jgi:hypothetical protein
MYEEYLCLTHESLRFRLMLTESVLVDKLVSYLDNLNKLTVPGREHTG